MSRENVELLHQLAAAWNRDDLDGWLALIDAEVEWHPGIERVDGGVLNGHEGARKFWATVHEIFEELVVNFEEVRDLGDTVLGLGRAKGGSSGGVPIDTEYGVVLRCRDGLIVSASDWFSRAEALEAAGLSK